MNWTLSCSTLFPSVLAPERLETTRRSVRWGSRSPRCRIRSPTIGSLRERARERVRARESTCHLTCGFHRPFSLSFFPPLSAQQNTQPQAQDAAGASRAQAKDEVEAEDRPQELEDRCKELKAQLAASKAQAEDRAKELEDRCKELEAQLAASKAQAAAAAAEEEAEDSDTVAQEPVRSTLANELRACVHVCVCMCVCVCEK